MDSPRRGFVENSVAKTLVVLAAIAAAFVATIPLTRSGVFRSHSISQNFVEFPVGGLLLLSAMLVLNVLCVWMVGALSGLR